MDREQNSDRERLTGVHRSEQSSESRVNEEFVEWLKTKGPTYLLIAVLLLLGYLWWIRLGDSREDRIAQAWHSLQEADVSGLPSSYEHVAEQYQGIGSIGMIARLRAAQQLMNAVQRGLPIGADGIDDEARLSESERDDYLSRAERLYQHVLETSGERRQQHTLFAIKASNGLAAIAEARGDLTAARTHFEHTASRAEREYPQLAAQARRRAETLGDADQLVVMPSAEDVERLFEPALMERSPVPIDRAFRDLLMQ